MQISLRVGSAVLLRPILSSPLPQGSAFIFEVTGREDGTEDEFGGKKVLHIGWLHRVRLLQVRTGNISLRRRAKVIWIWPNGQGCFFPLFHADMLSSPS
ncbi:hypothetical protein EDD85DRAFT_800430 [Armillaria nabsnona]|nr:hypothetical protein EDD85DRAFT_834514 [Armillaria nabsnona]KAK0245264.1 hypothetical protein EDD85DRAFT_800430 [Armillaria nabsnona]